MLKKLKKVSPKKLGLAIALIAIIILTLFYTKPLILNFTDSLPAGLVVKTSPEKINEIMPSDTLNCLYRLWISSNKITNLKSPIVDEYQYNLNGPHIEAINLWLFPWHIIFIPFSRIIGDVSAYNLIYLLSYIIAGLFIYLLANFYTKNFYASLFAAIVFVFAPSRIIHSFGHSAALLVFIFPLTIYLIEISLAKQKIIYSFLASLFVFAIALGEWHFFYYICIFIFLLYLYKIITLKYQKNTLKFILFSGLAVFSGLIVGILYLLFVNQESFRQSIVGAGRGIFEVSYYSPNFTYLINNLLDIEKNVYLGLVNLILVFFLFLTSIIYWKRVKREQKINIIFYFILFSITIILSLGINFPFIYELLYKYLPFFDTIRVPGRIMALVGLCEAILVAFSIKIFVELIAKKQKNKIRYVLYGLILVIAFLSFWDLTRIKIDDGSKTLTQFAVMPSRTLTGINTYLKEKTEHHKKILYLPYFFDYDYVSSIYQFNARESEKIMLNGYTPTMPLEIIDFYNNYLAELNQGELKDSTIEELKKIDVDSMVIYKKIDELSQAPYSAKYILEKLRSYDNLTILYEDEDGVIFKLR